MDKRKTVHDFFNKPENYLHKDFGIKVRKRIVKDILGGIKNKKILDAGCGNGEISIQFSKNNKISLMDISERMLIIAKSKIPKNNRKNVECIQSSIEDYNFNEKFDIIIAIGVLAHVPSAELTIQKLKLMLKSDGKIFLQFSDYKSILTKIRLFFGKPLYQPNILTSSELLKTIKNNSFELINKVQYSLLLPGMGLLSNRFLYRMTMASYKNKFFSNMGSDYIWEIKLKK